MSETFPNGVSYYTKGNVLLVINFPENKVKCQYCPFCRSENELKRFWCRLTNQMIYNPFYAELPEFCPCEITGETEKT